jgi:hypothetical protein
MRSISRMGLKKVKASIDNANMQYTNIIVNEYFINAAEPMVRIAGRCPAKSSSRDTYK